MSQHAEQFPDYQQLDPNSRAAREGRELEQQLAEATQKETAIRSRLAHLEEDRSPSLRGRLPWIALLLIGAVVVGAVLVLWWIFSKKRSAGCIVLALLAIAAPILLTFVYFVVGYKAVRSSPSAIIDSSVSGPTPSATSRYLLRRAVVQSGLPRGASKTPSHEFVCKFDALEIANGWELWLTQNHSHVVDGKSRGGGSGSLKIGTAGQGVMNIDDLEWNDQLQEDIQSELQKLMGAVITIQSGTPVSILNVTDSKGEQLEISVELRPAPDFSGQPATQLFVREVDSQPADGHLALAFNEILSVSGYDLVLETDGAAARFDSHDSLEAASFSAVNDHDEMGFSQRIIHQAGALRFEFPKVADFDSTSLLPSSGVPVKISPDQPWKIFDVTDLESGHRAWAELQLVPKGTVKEIGRPTADEKAELAPENAELADQIKSQPASPGSPHPPAPDGAAFVSDQRIVVPGDAVMRVTAYFLHRDDRDNEIPVKEPLVFKTPNNNAHGFLVRWHYYEAESLDEAGRFVIDFEIAETGMIFHRIEGSMPREQLLVTSKENQASQLQTTQIDRNGNRHFVSLLHARHPADPKASATDWWDYYCRVEWVRLDEKDTKPAFQLPPSPP